MTSEQPEKYAYCQNENNRNEFSPKIQKVSGFKSNYVWRWLFVQRNNSNFLEIAPSGKAKFKNRKCEEKKMQINLATE